MPLRGSPNSGVRTQMRVATRVPLAVVALTVSLLSAALVAGVVIGALDLVAGGDWHSALDATRTGVLGTFILGTGPAFLGVGIYLYLWRHMRPHWLLAALIGAVSASLLAFLDLSTLVVSLPAGVFAGLTTHAAVKRWLGTGNSFKAMPRRGTS